MPLIDLRCNSPEYPDQIARVLDIAANSVSDEPIELLTTCQPFPLYRAMENHGYQYVVSRIDGDGWKVTFRRIRSQE